MNKSFLLIGCLILSLLLTLKTTNAQPSRLWIISWDGSTRWDVLNSSDAKINQVKFGDFDADGIDDIFSTWGGNWYVSYKGTENWIKINKSNATVNKIKLADFNADGKADVFATWGKKWYVSYGGTGKWTKINSSKATVNKIKLADFNADGKADVFATWGKKWYVSYGGTGKWTKINSSKATVNKVKIADFNADGKADVFAAWGGAWYVSYGGTGKWTKINTSNAKINEIKLADFNNDNRADVFCTWGGNWYISVSGTGKWKKINKSGYTVKNVLLGDFTGNGNADVFTTVQQKNHHFRIRRFSTSALTNAEADGILNDATNIARTFDGGEDVSCYINMVRQGNVQQFNTGNGIINSEDDYDEIYGLAGNIKVVNQINWCGGFIPNVIGCATRGGNSLIVVRFTANQEGILWLHEFGHNQGIEGDYNIPNRVMNGTININNRRITSGECSKFKR